jgi:hypothetical protein
VATATATTAAAPATVTATFRRSWVAFGGRTIGILVVLMLAGCGGATHATAPGDATRGNDAYAWLRPVAPPRGWSLLPLPSGAATLAAPPGWRRIAGDPVSASVAQLGLGNAIEGFLNLTPRQGGEQLTNWAAFRLAHNKAEGEHDVRLVAAARGLPFRGRGRGSCITDDYRTTARSYREIACIVAGEHATAVVIGAAPPAQWAAESPAIERAIASVRVR